jgi:membrane fusion protein (multidrug efflux system)
VFRVPFLNVAPLALVAAVLVVPALAQVPVEAAKAEQRALVERFQAAGTLEADRAVTVSSEVAGRIAAVLFEEGSALAENQVLFRLDDAFAKAQLAEADASLAADEAALRRATQLAGRQVGTERAVDEARAALETTRARVQTARVQLDKTVIRAPFSGRADFRRVDQGAYVTPGQALVGLVDLDPLKLRFKIAERFAAAVKPGDEVSFTLQAFPDEVFRGKVTVVSPVVDVNGRSITIQASVANPGERLKPGMFADVTLSLVRHGDAIVIPEQAVVPQGGRDLVFRIVDGKATPVPVRLGVRQEGVVEVVEGLAAGDTVVTAGQMKLQPGAPVMPRPNGSGS